LRTEASKEIPRAGSKNQDDRFDDQRRRLRRPERCHPGRRQPRLPALRLACDGHSRRNPRPAARPVDYEELTTSVLTGNILRLGGTILGTTNRGNPFHYPMPDGSKKDRSGEIIEGYRMLGLTASSPSVATAASRSYNGSQSRGASL